eukprot:GHVT01101555.1.p2 GENE.GHVT01101555.1~~GHVT01101555.1.p2  ORF type:complete len:138 (-),score=16.20 GHVT01101555.1:136-549(-)
MYTRGGKSLPSPSHDLRSFPSAYARLDTSLFPEPMLEATEDILSICTFADNYSFVVDPSVCANPSEETTAPLVPSTASPVVRPDWPNGVPSLKNNRHQSCACRVRPVELNARGSPNHLALSPRRYFLTRLVKIGFSA